MHTYTTECHPATRKSKTLSFQYDGAEATVLWETNQAQKDKHCMITFTWGINPPAAHMEARGRTVVPRVTEWGEEPEAGWGKGTKVQLAGAGSPGVAASHNNTFKSADIKRMVFASAPQRNRCCLGREMRLNWLKIDGKTTHASLT